MHRVKDTATMAGEAVLGKIRGFELSSWNFIGHDPKEFATMVPWCKTSSPQQFIWTHTRRSFDSMNLEIIYNIVSY